MCVAPTRAQAEDVAGSVTLDLEELPAVHDMLAARRRVAGWYAELLAGVEGLELPCPDAGGDERGRKQRNTGARTG